jgi:hypothetical protein
MNIWTKSLGNLKNYLPILVQYLGIKDEDQLEFQLN